MNPKIFVFKLIAPGRDDKFSGSRITENSINLMLTPSKFIDFNEHSGEFFFPIAIGTITVKMAPARASAANC